MLVRVLTLVAVLQVVLTSTVRTDGSYKAIDPKEFVTIGGIRYYFSVILTDSITNAIRTCNDLGGSLVSLETQAENEAVMNYILNTPEHTGSKRFWTSGAYIENGWAWTGTGRPITYFNWGSNDPNVGNSTTQACVYLMGGAMLDTFCDYNIEIYFICEEDHC